MISGAKHKKHGDLARSERGGFGMNEVALLGTTCEEIQRITAHIRSFFPGYDIAFVDADHNEEQPSSHGTRWQKRSTVIGVSSALPDNGFQRRTALWQCDAIIVNGNHFEAKSQVIICDSTKEASLRKRSSQLTNVTAIILADGMEELPSYVKELVPGYERLEIIALHDEEGLRAFFAKEYLRPVALKGLIMTGGRSTRMGRDKSTIIHHEEEQYLHLAKLMTKLGVEPYISCRADQQAFFTGQGLNVIADRMIDVGPIGGILSAFMREPDVSWMVLACDIPLIDQPLLEELIASRRPTHTATVFRNETHHMPEPLIAIWEPRAYLIIMQFMAQGYSCPRKVLMNSNAHIISTAQHEKLRNVNTVAELDEFKRQRSSQ